MGGEDLESRGSKGREGYAGRIAYNTDLLKFKEKKWTSWLIPMFVIANVAVFVVVMSVNNCPAKPKVSGNCVGKFLGRFSFQPLRENPLLGPSSST